MIKFFRKIRQRLLSENRIKKYLLYAVGEIVLVVIGILIALSLNNLNEERKNKNYEKKVLKEISTSLWRDSIFNVRLLDRVHRRDTSINNVLSWILEGDKETDSVFLQNLIVSSLDIKISYDKGPYEALKAKGLEYINNDSLRNLIIRTYEVGLPRSETFGDEGRSDFINERRERELKILIDQEVVFNGKIPIIKESAIVDSEEKKNALKRYLNDEIKLSDLYKAVLNSQSRQINNLQILIDHELKKLEN